MNQKKTTALISALSLLLPIGVFAQAGSTGSSGSTSQYPSTGSSTQSGTSQSGTSQQYPGSTGTSGSSSQYPSTSSSSQSTQSGTSQQYPSTGSSSTIAGQMGGSHDQQFKLIKEDKLKDKKRTAENLRGKKIVDRDGRIVGTVQDIGLGSALQDGSGASSQTYASSGSGSAGAPTGRTSGTDASSTTSGIGSSTTSGSGTSSGVSSSTSGMASSGQSDHVTLYVKLDRNVGMEGDELAAIPASQVQFDRSSDQLQLQLGRTELLSQLRQSGSSSGHR